MTDTNSKIRPGIRAKFDDGREGIIGVPYDRHSFESWFEGEWGFAETDRLTPLPFKPGDRVGMGDLSGTVVYMDDTQWEGKPSETWVHFDNGLEVCKEDSRRLTLIDYPGKEAK